MKELTKSEIEKKQNRCKNIKRMDSMQHLIIILAILGISTIFAMIFAFVWFSGERLEIFPYLAVLDVNGLTEGEKWIIFVGAFIFTMFIPLLIIWCIYRWYRVKKCSDFDDAVETPIFE